MNKKKLLVLETKRVVLLIMFGMLTMYILFGTGCSSYIRQKDNKSDKKIIGVWLKWDEKQIFNANQYIKNTYLASCSELKNMSKKEREFKYSPQQNGLYIFNYIVYSDNKEILDKKTIASSALFVDETSYRKDKAINKVSIYKTKDFPKKIRAYDVEESSDGSISVSTSSVMIFDTVNKITRPRKFNKDDYSISIYFKNINQLDNVTIKEFDKDNNIINEEEVTKYVDNTNYIIDKNTSNVNINEKYIDNKGGGYRENYLYTVDKKEDFNKKHLCMFSEKSGLVYPVSLTIKKSSKVSN